MRGIAFVFVLALGACATAAPINAPLSGARIEAPPREATGEDVIILALSGGGARAASFHYGVLQALREARGHDGRPLTQHIALITSVSGGSVLAAYYALHGEAGLDGFDAAYLARDWSVRRPGSPLGWIGLTRGGMNGPAQLADWLDANVYDGARVGAMTAGPRVVINATDLYNATPFAFTPLFFDAICSNLTDVRVGDAVAASMAAPVAFRPVLLEIYPAACDGPPAWTGRVLADRTASENVRQTARAFQNYRGEARAAQRYLHLSDGGLVDNLGLLSLQVVRAAEPAPAPLTRREATQARRILFLVVNAEYIRQRTFQRRATDAIGAYEMIYSPIDVSTDVAKRASLDLLRASLPAFEAELRQYRCAARVADCEAISVAMDVITFRDMTPEEYEALYDAPTDVSLPRETVDALIAAGRGVVARNAAVAEFRRD
jgi:NTE family protein